MAKRGRPRKEEKLKSFYEMFHEEEFQERPKGVKGRPKTEMRDLRGKKVLITNQDSFYFNQYGSVTCQKGQVYVIELADKELGTTLLYRNEFKTQKKLSNEDSIRRLVHKYQYKLSDTAYQILKLQKAGKEGHEEELEDLRNKRNLYSSVYRDLQKLVNRIDKDNSCFCQG